MAPLPRPLTTTTCCAPALTASSTISWMVGMSTMGSISLGTALVAGRKRVPRPAAGMTTFRKGCFMAGRNLASGSDIGHTAAAMRLGLFVLLLGLAARADNLVTDAGAPFPGFIDMPRSTAMGGAQAAIATSNDALLVNPAGLPQNHRYHFELDGADDVHFPAQGI